jgi:hypothetical protein
MKFEVVIDFRDTLEGIRRKLPAELALLSRRSRDRYDDGVAKAVYTGRIDEQTMDLAVQWGQLEENGLANIIVINVLEEIYEPSELATFPYLEMYAPDGSGIAEIRNPSALVGTYECSHCRRIEWIQRDTIDVQSTGKSDLQSIRWWTWYASKRIAEVLESAGVVDTGVPDASITTVLTDPPTVPVVEGVIRSDNCPVCKRPQQVFRINGLEGVAPDDNAKFGLYRSAQLTIAPTTQFAILRSEEFGRFEPYPGVEHTLGETVAVGEAYPLKRAYFVNGDLYRALAAVNVTGVHFRPVTTI